MRKFLDNVYGSAVSFVIKLLVLGLIVTGIIRSFAGNIAAANANASVQAIPGGTAMLGILGLVFIVVPVALFAKAVR